MHRRVALLSPPGNFTAEAMFVSTSLAMDKFGCRSSMRGNKHVSTPCCQVVGLELGKMLALSPWRRRLGKQHFTRHGSSSLPSRQRPTGTGCFILDMASLMPLLSSCRIALLEMHKFGNVRGRHHRLRKHGSTRGGNLRGLSSVWEEYYTISVLDYFTVSKYFKHSQSTCKTPIPSLTSTHFFKSLPTTATNLPEFHPR